MKSKKTKLSPEIGSKPSNFQLKSKILEKTSILAEFSILAGSLKVWSQFPGLVLVFSISWWQANFFFRMFSFSFL